MNITVKNNLGEQFEIIVIRYFKFNGGNYLIFTKNEVDEAGYQKLYISKIENMIGNAIVDEVEWNLVRDTIKIIAKSNKDNTALPVQDLNEVEINGIQIMGQKPFKLTASSVNLLGLNKNVMVQPTVAPVTSFDQPNMAQQSPNSVINNVPVNSQSQTPTSGSFQSTPVVPQVSVESVQPESIMPGVPTIDNFSNQYVSTPSSAIDVAMQPGVSSNTSLEPMLDVTTPISPMQSVAQITPLNVEPFVPSPVSTTQPDDSVINDGMANDISTPNAMLTPQMESIDYKKLYEDQTLKLNTLTAELDKYKSIVEQIKNILS